MGLVKGLLASVFIAINTILVCVYVFVLALIRLVLSGKVRSSLSRHMDIINFVWTGCNGWMIKALRLSNIQVSWPHADELSTKNWYLVVCNHQSWTDIIILQSILFGVIPPPKFFSKQQLIWIPFVGQAMYLLGFPYVRRITRQQLKATPQLRNYDRNNTLEACNGFRDHPTSVLNFLEGTRFTPEKHARQSARFEHLLNPRIAGLGYVMIGLSDHLHRVVDVTIIYPHGVPGFWDFLCGRCPEVLLDMKNYEIPEELLKPESERLQRAALGTWVEGIWAEKDARIAAQLKLNLGKGV